MLKALAAADAQNGFHLGLVIAAFTFGLRHGIDWDHIAAITDIASSQTGRKALRLASLYVVGHAAVVLVLGLAAIELGTVLPEGIDAILERVVGVTLLLLGSYVFYGLMRYKRDFRMRSRWMLLISGTRRIARYLTSRTSAPTGLDVIEHDHDHDHGDRLHATHDHETAPRGPKSVLTKTRQHRHRHRHVGSMPKDPFMEYGTATSLIVGIVHGIGAETPTQILLFLVAVQVGGRIAGAALLTAFIAGLIVSNTLIALASTFGFLRAGRSFVAYASVAVLAGSFSLVLGTLFVLGRGSVMPAILVG